MNYKMIAIGILTLLAFSSVMNPKAFRFFIGVLAVATVTLVTGYFVFASYPPPQDNVKQNGVARQWTRLRTLLHGKPTWDETAQSTSQRILAEFNHGIIGTDAMDDLTAENEPKSKQNDAVNRRPRVVVARRVHVPSASSDQELATIVQKLRHVVDAYLTEFKKEHKSADVALLRPEHLNLTLLTFREKKSEGGEKKFTVVFDDAFREHIFIRARQLVIRKRLIVTTYVCFGTGVVMCLIFGSLKVTNARKRVRPENDFLQLSGISMV